MPARDLVFGTSLTPDPALVQNARYVLDAADRQSIDTQVRTIQQFLSDGLLRGTIVTFVRFSDAHDGAAGDVVCAGAELDGGPTCRIAIPASLSTSGVALGVLVLPVSVGGLAAVALTGFVSPRITGLAAAANGWVRVSAGGRCEKVTEFGAADVTVGYVDAAGYLRLGGMPAPPAGGSATAAYLENTATALNANGVPIQNLAATLEVASTSTIPLAQKRTDSATAALVDVEKTTVLSTGTPLANFGGSHLWQAKNGAGSAVDLGQWGFLWTNPAAGAEASRCVIRTRTAGAALATVLTVDGTGIIKPTGDLTIATGVGGLILNPADGTEEHREAGTLIRTDTFGVTGHFQVYEAGVAQVASIITQAASGAGVSRLTAAGQGAPGSAGGSLTRKVGDGGTPGTNAPGNDDVVLGTAVSGVTGKQRWLNAANGVLAIAGQEPGPVFEIAGGAVCTGGISLRSTGGKALVHTLDGVVEGYDGDTLGWALKGDNAGVGSLVFNGSSVASARVEVDKPTGSGSTAGRHLTVRAGDGQDSGGAANTGGTLFLSSAGAGTGTGPVHGSVILAVNDVPELTIEHDGATITNTFEHAVTAPAFVIDESNPTASSGTLTLDLTESGAPFHVVTEAVTVSITGGEVGQHGTVVFKQNDPAYAVTMPAGAFYADDIAALGLGGVVENAIDTMTILRYRIIDVGGETVLFDQRAVRTA